MNRHQPEDPRQASTVRVVCETCRGHGDIHLGFGKFMPCRDCYGAGYLEVDAELLVDRFRHAGAL